MHIIDKTKFTDDEKRLFLSAMEREKQICEEVDLHNILITNEIPIDIMSVTDLCESIKNKVIDTLF